MASNTISTVRMEELQRKFPNVQVNALQYMQSPRSAFIFGILLFAIMIISAAIDDLGWNRSFFNELVV